MSGFPSPSAPGAPPSSSCTTTRRRRGNRPHFALTPAACSRTRESFSALDEPSHYVGSSKTIRSLAKLGGLVAPGIGDTERMMLRRSQLDDWVPRLARLTAASRPELPGITTDRTFQIVAGGIVLSEAMSVFSVKELDVSPWAMREGVILRYLDQLE
jgi:exopolyphosphatase/guanosine-5'-triphosphate,3'-diphosphate pyrophosphatase